jgi:hypothetical protein
VDKFNSSLWLIKYGFFFKLTKNLKQFDPLNLDPFKMGQNSCEQSSMVKVLINQVEW